MHTKKSHVKMNLVHSLHQILKYGVLPLTSFNDFITPLKYRRYEESTKYNFIVEVFVTFYFMISIFTIVCLQCDVLAMPLSLIIFYLQKDISLGINKGAKKY
jgi:glycerol uptake facilitator-like aquaporin